MLTEDQIYVTWKAELEKENDTHQRDLEILKDEEFELSTKRKTLQNVMRINLESGYGDLNSEIKDLFDINAMNTRYSYLISSANTTKMDEISTKIEANKLVIEYLNKLV